MMKPKLLKGIRPIHVLPIGFAAIILFGTLLLMLPASTRDGQGTAFLPALFTATSASCVTGLVVVDTGTYFSLFGQAVILILIQLGGLGFMSMATILFVLMKKRISLRERMTMAESFGESRLQGTVRLCMNAAALTGAFELAGAILLSIRFVPAFGLGKGVWYALFHSVSAFCNAGFDLIGNYQSFVGYTNDVLVNFTLMALVVTGGLGYAVLLDVGKKQPFSRLRLHTKLVLTGTAVLLFGGALIILAIEWGNAGTMGALTWPEKVMAALFQSVTFRTAGFNTIDQAALRDATKFIGSFLMLTGGAPAGTAGGLKVTTVLTMLLALRAQARGKRDIEAFGRRLPTGTVRQALSLVTIGIAVMLLSVTAISLMEDGGAGFSFIDQLYEAASALATVGLSVGVSGSACTGTRVCLILMMYMGRVGMLTLALSLAGGRSEALMRCPEENILIG